MVFKEKDGLTDMDCTLLKLQVLLRPENSNLNELWRADDIDALRRVNRADDQLGHIIVVAFEASYLR